MAQPSPEITQYDAFTAAPMNAELIGELIRKDFEPINIDTVMAVHRAVIERKASAVSTMLQAEAPVIDPLQKLQHEAQVIDEFVRSLGPTNTLHDANGHDAMDDFALLRHRLESDFQALPEPEQRPEYRMTEAVLAEEMAVLYQPIATLDSPAVVDPVDDPNLFDTGQINATNSSERRTVAAIALASEAEQLFRDITKSPTADPFIKLIAESRATDMALRQLGIAYSAAKDPRKQQAILERMRTISSRESEFTESARAFLIESKDPHSSGRIFDHQALQQARKDLLVNYDGGFIRFALPREDRVSRELPTIMNADNFRAKVAYDIIKETATGAVATRYQTKYLKPSQYASRVRREHSRYMRGLWHHSQYLPLATLILKAED